MIATINTAAIAVFSISLLFAVSLPRTEASIFQMEKSPSLTPDTSLNMAYFKKIFKFIFRQRLWERHSKEDKHQCMLPCHGAPCGDLAENSGKCPHWELNQ